MDPGCPSDGACDLGKVTLFLSAPVSQPCWLPRWISGHESACQRRGAGFNQSLCGEDHLEEGMETHSSILAWRIPWTEEPTEAIARRIVKSGKMTEAT